MSQHSRAPEQGPYRRRGAVERLGVGGRAMQLWRRHGRTVDGERERRRDAVKFLRKIQNILTCGYAANDITNKLGHANKRAGELVGWHD